MVIAPGAAVHERDDARRIAVWRRLQHDRPDDAEDRDVGADAERQGDDRGGGESWRAAQQPERVTDVATECPDPRARRRRTVVGAGAGRLSAADPRAQSRGDAGGIVERRQRRSTASASATRPRRAPRNVRRRAAPARRRCPLRARGSTARAAPRARGSGLPIGHHGYAGQAADSGHAIQRREKGAPASALRGQHLLSFGG